MDLQIPHNENRWSMKIQRTTEDRHIRNLFCGYTV